MNNSMNVQLEMVKELENIKLPEPELLEYYRNLKDRVIWIDFDINDALLEVSKAVVRINKEDKDNGIAPSDRKPIKLLIFTNGGNIDAMFQLMDVIALSKTPVYTYNMGNAMSAGFQLLIAGHKRFCLANSVALYHSGSGMTAGTYEQTEAQMKEYKRAVTVLEKNTLERTKIDPKIFSKNKSKEWYMDADTQVKYGVVDAVVTDIDEIYN